jgi:hypothetical protein
MLGCVSSATYFTPCYSCSCLMGCTRLHLVPASDLGQLPTAGSKSSAAAATAPLTYYIAAHATNDATAAAQECQAMWAHTHRQVRLHYRSGIDS